MNMNLGYGNNVNVNQTYQRALTQSCFKCQGDGKLYPFEGKRGIPKECNACKGMRVIDGSFSKCFVCQGEGKIYPFEGKRGIPGDCKSCEGMGYQPTPMMPCTACNGEGKTYPFEGRRGIPSDCNKCMGKGGFPTNQKYLVTTTTTTNYNNNYVPNTNYNQGNNFNQIPNNNFNNNYNQNQNWNQGNNFNQVPNNNFNYNQNQNFNYNQNQNMNYNQNQNQNYNYNQNWNQQGTNSNFVQSTSMIQTSFEPMVNKLSQVHYHPLSKGNRTFTCDTCSIYYNFSGSNYCSICDFDICDSCANRVNNKMQNTDAHNHNIQPTKLNSNWSCNTCGIKHDGGLSWRCTPCDFDVCIYCSFP
jgi:hypothetical protein